MKYIFQNENEAVSLIFLPPLFVSPDPVLTFQSSFSPPRPPWFGVSYLLLRFSNNSNFQYIDFNLWRFVASIAYLSMCVQFQTSCVSFVLLALGLCFSWITWVQDDSVQKI